MRATTTGTAAAAWVIAVAVLAAMLLSSGPARVVLLVVGAVLQIGLHVGALRLVGPSSPRRIAVLWSTQASLTWLVAGDDTTSSAPVYVVTGLVFALVAEVVLRLAGRVAAGDPGDPVTARGDTAPLPVVDGEG